MKIKRKVDGELTVLQIILLPLLAFSQSGGGFAAALSFGSFLWASKENEQKNYL